jgi:hypothetical protein
MKKSGLILLVLVGLLIIGCQQAEAKKYKPTWESIRQYKAVPEWLRDGKFGIYTHWGPYAVHAYGENTTWYSFGMYVDPDGEARKHFEENFGKLTPEFGYKDLIPKRTNGQIYSKNPVLNLQAPWRNIMTDSRCGTRSIRNGTQRRWARSGML